MSSVGRVRIVPLAGAAAGVALITLLIQAILWIMPIPNLAVLYLLGVMLCAVTWGWWSALEAGVLAFLAYDFFFVEPRYTITIRDPQEWLSLLIFLAVAAVTSNLAARERARREQASRQARTATMLYELSRALGGQTLEDGLRAVLEQIVSEFRLAGAVVARSSPDGRLTPIIAVGQADTALGSEPAGRVFAPPTSGARAARWIIVRPAQTAPRKGRRSRLPVANFPLRHDRHDIGMLRLVGRSTAFADDETSILATIADRLAVALEQEALQAEANRAEILRQTDELRTALLNSVSHDLRTPLAAIKASAESLLQHDVDWTDEDRDDFAAAINREADRLTRLVTNLLDMSRIEGGALRPQRDWYDLGELIREVRDRLRPALADRPVHIVVPDDLPPVSLDYLMIDQVVTNLIENAVKYTPAGTALDIAVGRRGDRVQVAVTDHGPGIPPDKRNRVFDKFYRLETRGITRGSGLGLAVSRGLIEAHGGRIWVEAAGGTREGTGSRFVFELPAVAPVSVLAAS
jgi:two-component system sensor histidine kinase KdpD